MSTRREFFGWVASLPLFRFLKPEAAPVIPEVMRDMSPVERDAAFVDAFNGYGMVSTLPAPTIAECWYDVTFPGSDGQWQRVRAHVGPDGCESWCDVVSSPSDMEREK
jgi:hypothetical protein